MKIGLKPMVSESAALTPAQEKKIVLGSELDMSVVRTNMRGGGPATKENHVEKITYKVVEVLKNKADVIKSVTLAAKGNPDVSLTAASLSKLLQAPIPKKTDKLHTKSLRVSKVGSGRVGKSTGQHGVAKQLSDIKVQLSKLDADYQTQKKALEDQYARLAKKAGQPTSIRASRASGKLGNPAHGGQLVRGIKPTYK